MRVDLKEINSYTCKMTIFVPWEELEASFYRWITQFTKQVSLPGFRRGRVPRRIILQNFRPEIEADFSQNAVEEYYWKAIKMEGMSPVNRAKIENLEFHEGMPLKFSAIFEVVPEIILPKYRKKLKVKKNIYIPDEEDVVRYIEEIRQHYSELTTVESGSEEGHLLLVDMQELDRTGVPIIGRKVEDRYLKIGEGVFGGDNLKRLTGLKAGDKTIIHVRKQNEQELVGYEVSVKNVHQEILPELDKKFIQQVDKNASTEEEFRKNIFNRIQSRLDRDSKMQLHEAFIDYFLQNIDLEIPPSLIDNYINNVIEEKKSQNGETINEKQLRNELRPSTIKNLKWYFIRKALIKSEDLRVSDEEVAEKVEKIVEAAGENVKEVRRFYRKPSNREKLREDLLDQKLFDLLESIAKINEVIVYTKDLRKQQVN